MPFPFRNILCPVDFDHSSPTMLDFAAGVARQNDGTLFVLHVVPMILAPSGWGAPIYGIDIYKTQEETAHTRLLELAGKYLPGLKYELLTPRGEPVEMILRAEKQIPADLVVMATHGRRGLAHVFLGSVAEAVVRRSYCPVLTVHCGAVDKHLVAHWMSANPVTAAPDDKLATIQQRMLAGKFRAMPVVKEGTLTGIITDRDIRAQRCNLETTLVEGTMTRAVLTVTPRQSVRDAARLLAERKIGGMPVLDEQGALVGIITTTDLLRAFAEMQDT
jgi:nucleotide-binding universal stress UspA family protein/predicted transcriptional regulator